MAKRLSAAAPTHDTKPFSPLTSLALVARVRSSVLLKTTLPQTGGAFSDACRTYCYQYSYVAVLHATRRATSGTSATD